MRGDIQAHELPEPHHGNRWTWLVALDDDEFGAKICGFASTEESAMRHAEYAVDTPTRRVPAPWAEHAHLAPQVVVALQATADRLGIDLDDDYDTVREAVTELRDAGYSNRQITHLPDDV